MQDHSVSTRFCWVALALFTLFLLVVNQFYYRSNKRPPTYDEAWYLETSVMLYDAATHAEWGRFLYLYKTAFQTKAPLISVLPLPFYLIFGPSQTSALLVNSLFVAVSNVCLFLLGRRLFSAEAGLAAVIFYQTMPLVYGLSRTVMTEYGLATLVLVWSYCLVVSERLTRGAVNLALGAVFGLGLLMKILFPAFIAGPLLLVWIWRRRARLPSPYNETFWLWGMCARWPLAALAVPALAVAATWYAFNLANVVRFAWSNAYGEIAAGYGAAGLGQRALRVINEGMSSYYAGVVVIAGILALAVRRPRLREMVESERAWFLAGWLLPPLFAIAAGRNLEIRFTIPVLPVFAIFLAVSACTLARRVASLVALVALLLIFPILMFASLSFPVSVRGSVHPLQLGPFTLLDRSLGVAHPPDSEGRWTQQRIVEALQQIRPVGRAPRYVVIGVEHPYFNANLLSYINTCRGYNWRFTSLGYAESSVDRAIERLLRLDTQFLIMAEGFHTHDLTAFLNQINVEIQARLDRQELPFRLRAKVPLHGEIQAVIYERESPWTRFPPGAAFEPPSHTERVDFLAGPRFVGFDWKRKDRNLGEITWYWMAPHRIYEDFRVHLVFNQGPEIDQYLAGGRHPFFDWEPGEVLKQTVTVYLPAGPPLEARLWLETWGPGPPHQIVAPKQWIHESVIRLRLEE